jgi:hypothetical protein
VGTGSPSEYTPFTQSNPIGGASLLLYRDLFMIGGNGFRADTLNLEINLEGLPQLPAGTYTGPSTCRRKCCDPGRRWVSPSYSVSSALICGRRPVP